MNISFFIASSGAWPYANQDNFSEFILMYIREEKLKLIFFFYNFLLDKKVAKNQDLKKIC
jgi:hypothetical protein